MTIDEFLEAVGSKGPPAPMDELTSFERELGTPVPDDYRGFLLSCNGGHVGGALWFTGSTPDSESADAGVNHVGGLRKESHLSLRWARECYAGRIPSDLLWIMDDPFGNAICLGLRGPYRGRVYFWDHEAEPDPDHWDGQVEAAGNLQLLAESFAEFVAGVHPVRDA